MLVGIGVVAVALLLSSRAIARIYVDSLWYQSVGHGEMFWGMLRPKLFLYVMFAASFVLLAVLNLVIADRLMPKWFHGSMHPAVERLLDVLGPRLRAARLVVAMLLGLLMAIPAAGQWQQWEMFRHSKGFGIADPQFGNDIGFYLFKLPFLTFAIDWVFLAVAMVTVLTVAAHVINGGIVLTPPRPKVRQATKAHIAVLLAVLALVKAADYWVARYETTTETRGIVRGALYSVVNAELPAISVLALIAVMVAGLFLSTLKTESWRLPVIASGLWVAMALVGGVVAPEVVQGLIVNPNQKDREAPYIARNVEATRHALGIDDVVRRSFVAEPLSRTTLDASVGATSGSALQDVRMVSPEVMVGRFNADKGTSTGWAVNDLDVDRYDVDGRVQQVIVGARELDLSTVGNTSWQGTHLISTHGCGVIFAPANRVDSIGRPQYTEPELEHPQLYVSPTLDGYSIVNTDVSEQACPGVTDQGYDGVAGVRLSSGLRRLAFALTYFDYNLFGSSAINDDSRVITVRRVQDRVQKVAPFLTFDSDPYPVVMGGRVLWIVDGYTTSDRYPYAQRGDRTQVGPDSGLAHPFNYVRNSVKAVVDAYDATVSLYVVDDNDPVIKVWQSAFPSLFEPRSELHDLEQHLRYPEDLFRIQTAAYAKYQLDPQQFLERGLAWSVAPAPSSSPGRSPAFPTSTDTSSTDTDDEGGVGLATDNPTPRFEPYFTMFREPDGSASAPTFRMLRPFVPFSPTDRRPELRSFMTVGSDPGDYGRLTVYDAAIDPAGVDAGSVPGAVDPTGVLRPDGPITVQAGIESSPDVSRNVTQWNQEGSRVTFGDLQVVPLATSSGNALAWVRPLYLQPASSQQPSFRQVVVSVDGRVAMGDSLRQALSQLFPGFNTALGDVVGEASGVVTTPDGPVSPGTGTGTPGGAVATAPELLAQAKVLFDEATTALKAGDLGTYQAKVDQARRLVEQAAELLGP